MANQDDKENANPTILNVSEISRRREKRKVRDYSAKKYGIQSIMMARPSYALDPFYMSDFSDEDSDDSGLEPIDEQEIYGKGWVSSSIYYQVSLWLSAYASNLT